jgi:hypothetical protein
MTDATEKATSQRVNLNTWLSIAGFAVVILGGAMRIGGFEADVEARLKDAAAKVAELQLQQNATTVRIDSSIQSLEAATNTLNIRDARNDERMNSILETLRRIDAKLTAQDLRENGGKP